MTPPHPTGTRSSTPASLQAYAPVSIDDWASRSSGAQLDDGVPRSKTVPGWRREEGGGGGDSSSTGGGGGSSGGIGAAAAGGGVGLDASAGGAASQPQPRRSVQQVSPPPPQTSQPQRAAHPVSWTRCL